MDTRCLLFFATLTACGADHFVVSVADSGSVDSAAPIDAGMDARLDAPSATPRIVFVTSQTMTGDIGGLAKADQACQSLAVAANLPGTYLAWLSDAGHAAHNRLFPSTGPYVLTDGTLVADNFDGLVSGYLKHPIDRTETKALANSLTPIVCAGKGSLVWTGTNNYGYAAPPFCKDWNGSDAIASGTVGDYLSATGTWTNACSQACAASLPIYCIGQ